VTALRRLDAELVRRRLAPSREAAAELVAGRRVTVDGRRAENPASMVRTAAAVVVGPATDDATRPYVSRGAHKLRGALDAFAPDGLLVAGRRCLDAGASTGGFTDVLLRAGARQVIAVDVGYGELAWSLRNDPRVVVVERTNVRALTPEAIDGHVELIVGDLSFISLTRVLPALRACATPEADVLLLVKPQFELDKDRVGAGGVVRDPAAHADAVRGVASAAREHTLGVRGVTASPLPGPAGNVEYFLWLRADAGALDEAALDLAIRQGPAGTVRGERTTS
jgi:23S rRNA (cytidine1920-2'-O)/16S rRNA (cytidine1409-2'-O)-methyltransferase